VKPAVQPCNLNAGSNMLGGVSCGTSSDGTGVGGTQDAGQIETMLNKAGD
jgi:hypothetical protein